MWVLKLSKNHEPIPVYEAQVAGVVFPANYLGTVNTNLMVMSYSTHKLFSVI